MQTLINTSFQAFEIYLITEKGPSTYWLKPNEYINIPKGYVSPQIRLLVDRRQLRLQEAV